jgi:two-component system, NarL family, sensor kinase
VKLSRSLKLYTLTVLFLTFQQLAFGQVDKPKKDSLLNLLRVSKKDTNQVMLLIGIGQQFENTQPDSAAIYYKRAGDLSDSLQYYHGMVKYIANYTYLLNVKGEYGESLQLNLKAIEYSTKSGLLGDLAMAYGNTAAVYQYMSDYQKSVQYYLYTIPILEELNDKQRMAVLTSNLVALYRELKQYEKAKEYGYKVIAYFQSTGDKIALANSYNNMSTVFLSTNEYKTSIEYCQKAYNISKEIVYPQGQMTSLLNQVVAYSQVKAPDFNIDEVIYKSKEAVRLAQSINDEDGVVAGLIGLCKGYFLKKDYEKSGYYWRQSFAIALKLKFTERLSTLYKLKSDLGFAQQDFRAAYFYRDKYDSLSGVLMNESLLKNIQNLEIKYENEKKEARIKTLEQEKQIQAMSIQQKNILIYAFISSIPVLLLIGFLFYLNNKSKHTIQAQKIKELEQQRQIIAAESILKGQESERYRIAQDLHDGVGSMLSSLKLTLSTMSGILTSGQDNTRLLAKASEQLNSSIDEIRRVAHNMMPEALLKLGLQQALQDCCDSVSESKKLRVNTQFYGLEERLEATKEIVIYRIIQELVNNCVKHANATSLLVQVMKQNHELNITVEDNGVGFSIDTVKSKNGAGLSNIHSRVDYLIGQIDIQSKPGMGTSVYIHCRV